MNRKSFVLLFSMVCVLVLSACSSSPKYNGSTSGYKNPAPVSTSKRELTESEKMLSKIEGLESKKQVFNPGNYVKGDIPKGEYAFVGKGDIKYYCEKDAAGNIIDNENFESFGYVYVHGLGNVETRGILVSIDAFDDLGVTGAKELYEIIHDHHDYTQSGMYKIGADLPSGTYTVESIGQGYYALVSGPVGNNKIIDNDLFMGKTKVSTRNGQYLELSRAMLVD